MKNVDKFFELLEKYGLDGEQVADLFVNYKGLQILENDFIEFVKDELGISDEE